MPYPRELLNDHEEVAVDLHPHWWYYAPPTFALVGGIALGLLTLAVTEPGGGARTLLGWLSLVVLAVAVVWLVSRYVRWATTNFVVTSDRLIFRTGVFHRIGTEIPLERVNTVHFSQRFAERLVGTGDLMIESGAVDGQQRFTDIKDPDRVQREIHRQMESNERRRFTPPDPVEAPIDVAGQLSVLEGMLERGTLTRDEFDAQKARLLGS